MTDAANQYGRALYELAGDEGLGAQILKELGVLEESFSQEPDFLQLLAAPSVSKTERCQVLDRCFRDKIHPYLLNFLKILTEKGYIRQFSGCCKVFRQCYNLDNGILPVTVVTALPLQEDQSQKLTEKLSSITGKTIELHSRIDPSCLGGVRLDFDGKQVDGTVRRRLEDVRNLLKNTVL